MARSTLGSHGTRTPDPASPSPFKTVSTDGVGHRGEEGAWAGGTSPPLSEGGQRAGEGWRHAMRKDAGTAKVPLPSWQTGPGMSLTHTPALAASSRLLLRCC